MSMKKDDLFLKKTIPIKKKLKIIGRKPRQASPLEVLGNFLICGTMQLNLDGYLPSDRYPPSKDYILALQNRLSKLGYRADCMSLNDPNQYLLSIKPQKFEREH